MISEAKLREIEDRAEKATPGPWIIGESPDIYQANARFIAASRTDIPALTKALREAAEMVAALHPPKQCVVSGKCRECEWLREWRGEREKQGGV